MDREREHERSQRRQQLAEKLRTMVAQRSTPIEDAMARFDHEALPWMYSEPAFRMLADTDVYRDGNGNFVAMKLCESYEAGSWEPFYAVANFAPDRSN